MDGKDLDSRTSNESTADILRNQGTKSLGRDSEKVMTIRSCLLTIAIYIFHCHVQIRPNAFLSKAMTFVVSSDL